MNPDTFVVHGSPDLPVAVFIHGLGMDHRIWAAPEESRILGGRFPVSLLLCREPGPGADVSKGGRLTLGVPPSALKTLFHDMSSRGFPVIAWSQQRPAAGISVAVEELREVIGGHERLCRSGVILVGHSRGGLIARMLLAGGESRVRALVTLSTPHCGSRMAQWAEFLSPAAALLAGLLPEARPGTVMSAVSRVARFLSGRAVAELLPGSAFFRSLDDRRTPGVYYLSVGGSDPTLFSVYRSGRGGGKAFSRRDPALNRPQKVFSVPAVFEQVFPGRIFPEEMKTGLGDGLVSLASSRLPGADEHLEFPVNHAGILFEEAVRIKVLDWLGRIV